MDSAAILLFMTQQENTAAKDDNMNYFSGWHYNKDLGRWFPNKASN